MSSIEIAVLTDQAMADFLDAIQAERGDAEWQRLAGFMRDIPEGARTLWTAKQDGTYVGMVSVRWQSDYPGFRTAPSAPEIIDLYVWQVAREQGIATQLMQVAEQAIRDQNYKRVGLSVGLLQEDAPAWSFYLKRGYQFDGTGAWWQGQKITASSMLDCDTAPVLVMMDKLL